MGQARAVEIVFAGLEDLGLGLQAAERAGEHDAAKILLEDAAVIRPPLGVVGVAEILAIKRAVKIIRH